MVKKGRAANLGESMGAVLELTFLAIPEDIRAQYKEEFFKQLGTISLVPRKKGDPPLRDVEELEGLEVEELDLPNNPANLARVIKEDRHFDYNVPTKRRIMLGIFRHCGVEPPDNIKNNNGKSK
jgi:hypothetical protein